MGWLHISPALDANGDPKPLPEWAKELNREEERHRAFGLGVEELAEAEVRDMEQGGWNKP